MTPIEELRKGLDERGVRHIDHDGRGQEGTVWYDPDTTHWSLYGRAFKYTSKQGQDGRLYVKTSGATDWVEMTPEQAISATVGAGTCHDLAETPAYRDKTEFKCSEFDYEYSAVAGFDWGHGDEPDFNFCPNCGRRIVG